MNYYKVNAKVAEYLNLTAERNMTKDGNYILWVADINRFGSLANISGILEDIGGVALSSADVVKELRGEMSTKLPEPKDARFVVKSAVSASDNEGTGGHTDNTANEEAAGEENTAEEIPVDTVSLSVEEGSENTEDHQTEEPAQVASEEVTEQNIKEG